MGWTPSLEEQVRALESGAAVLDLADWTSIEVLGADAEAWLNDLVTANVALLHPGDSVRSLLLGPTGRIRADLLVHRGSTGFLLLQGPGQPRPIDELLSPYVLSSDVALRRPEATSVLRPSASGPWNVLPGPAEGTPTSAEAFESWRIRSGSARFPVDLDEDSVPAEAGLDRAPIVDGDKGCYLGQEAVAKIRNLGHPTRLVVSVLASGPVAPGEEVLAGSMPAGKLTSVDPSAQPAALARIRWEARGAGLITAGGASLTRR